MSSGEPRGDRQLLEDLQERLRAALDDADRAVADAGVLRDISTALLTGTLVTRCAWCDRYHLADRWLAVPRSLLGDGIPASHGICPDCVDELRRAGRSR